MSKLVLAIDSPQLSSASVKLQCPTHASFPHRLPFSYHDSAKLCTSHSFISRFILLSWHSWSFDRSRCAHRPRSATDFSVLDRLLMAISRQVSAVLSLVVAVILGAASYAEGQVLFSKLPRALVVTATLPGGEPITEITVGMDTILVTWSANSTFGVPITATKVRTKLCFAKESQIHRAWRATKDNLSKDKTCQFDIAIVNYTPAGAFVNWTLPKKIPGAKYCVRAYALDVNGNEVAYGQSSPDRIANTFSVTPFSGRTASLNVAVAFMSITSVVLLFSFFIFEYFYLKRKKSV